MAASRTAAAAGEARVGAGERLPAEVVGRRRDRGATRRQERQERRGRRREWRGHRLSRHRMFPSHSLSSLFLTLRSSRLASRAASIACVALLLLLRPPPPTPTLSLPRSQRQADRVSQRDTRRSQICLILCSRLLATLSSAAVAASFARLASRFPFPPHIHSHAPRDASDVMLFSHHPPLSLSRRPTHPSSSH